MNEILHLLAAYKSFKIESKLILCSKTQSMGSNKLFEWLPIFRIQNFPSLIMRSIVNIKCIFEWLSYCICKLYEITKWVKFLPKEITFICTHSRFNFLAPKLSLYCIKKKEKNNIFRALHICFCNYDPKHLIEEI